VARAGHPVPIIQLFGRWGSSVVLRYIRDAALGSRGGSIAQRTEGGSFALVDAEEQIAQKVLQVAPATKPGAMAARCDAELDRLARRVLPAVLAAVPTLEQQRDFERGIRHAVSTITSDLAVLSGTAQPRFVQCTGGKAHCAADEFATLCDWQWRAAGATMLLTSRWDELGVNERCKLCVRRM